MKKNFLQTFQISCLIYFLARCCLLGISLSQMFTNVHQDAWLSVFIAFIIGLVLLLIYLYLINYKLEYNIIKLNTYIFGTIIGTIINIFICLCIFIYAICIFWNFTNFITTQYLSNTPLIAIGGLLSIPLFYILIKDIETITKTAIIVFFISILIYSLSLFGLFNEIDLNNIMPILENGINPVIKNSIYSLCFNVGPIFLITIVPKSYFKKEQKFNMPIIFMYIFNALFVCYGVFTVLAVLGPNLSILYEYAEVQVLKRVVIFGFVDRIESIISLRWIFDIFITLTMTLYFILIFIKETFKIKKQKIIDITVFILIILLNIINCFAFKNKLVFNNFISKVLLPLCLISFIIIPLILFVICLIKKSKDKLEHNKHNCTNN